MHIRAIAAAVAACAVAAATPASAADATTLLSFEGAIGVDPVAGITNGAPATNTVLGIPPGGRPWILRKFSGRIATDGSMSLKGRGLLFSGGDLIGTRGGVTSVFATLFCGGVQYHSPAADLDLQGNFTIRGSFGTVPPSPCVAPTLLIRNAAGTQAWFAAGLVGDDD